MFQIYTWLFADLIFVIGGIDHIDEIWTITQASPLRKYFWPNFDNRKRTCQLIVIFSKYISREFKEGAPPPQKKITKIKIKNVMIQGQHWGGGIHPYLKQAGGESTRLIHPSLHFIVQIPPQ